MIYELDANASPLGFQVTGEGARTQKHGRRFASLRKTPSQTTVVVHSLERESFLRIGHSNMWLFTIVYVMALAGNIFCGVFSVCVNSNGEACHPLFSSGPTPIV